MLLFATMLAPAALAQQSAEVKSDPHVNVEVPNRSVEAVDVDPEKAKDDAAATRAAKAKPQYSTWGLQRSSAQNTALEDSAGVNQRSTWALQSRPQSTTAPGDAMPQEAGATRKALVRRESNSVPATKTKVSGQRVNAGSATGWSSRIGNLHRGFAGGGSLSEADHSLFDPAAALRFDPMRNFSTPGPTSHTGRRHRLSRAQVNEYCHARLLSDDARRLCAQSKKQSAQDANAPKHSTRTF